MLLTPAERGPDVEQPEPRAEAPELDQPETADDWSLADSGWRDSSGDAERYESESGGREQGRDGGDARLPAMSAGEELAALGAEVTVLSTSDRKKADAERMGARHFLINSDAEAMKAAAERAA